MESGPALGLLGPLGREGRQSHSVAEVRRQVTRVAVRRERVVRLAGGNPPRVHVGGVCRHLVVRPRDVTRERRGDAQKEAELHGWDTRSAEALSLQK